MVIVETLLFSWLILSEEITVEVIVALVMVAIGIYLVNRKPKVGTASLR